MKRTQSQEIISTKPEWITEEAGDPPVRAWTAPGLSSDLEMPPEARSRHARGSRASARLLGWLALGLVLVTSCRSSAPALYRPYRAQPPHAGDVFSFWGWSTDGRRFAFATYSAGGGLPECAEWTILTVIDAEQDRPVEGGVLRVDGGREDEEGKCIREGDRALATQRDAFLRKHGIVAGSFPDPVSFEFREGQQWAVLLPSGRMAIATFDMEQTQRIDVTEDPSRPGASYRFVLPMDERRPVTVETEALPGVSDYDPSQSMLFFHPGQRYAALFVAQVNSVHHGTWITWNAHGLALSASAPSGNGPEPAE